MTEDHMLDSVLLDERDGIKFVAFLCSCGWKGQDHVDNNYPGPYVGYEQAKNEFFKHARSTE